MKHLTLLLILILSANAWADDEFPIELTCEIGGSIVYFNFNQTKEGSWWKPHSSHSFGGKFTSPFFNNKAFKDKENTNFKKFKIAEGQINFSLSGLNSNVIMWINRYTLGINGFGSGSGQCYKGFKEYEKQI